MSFIALDKILEPDYNIVAPPNSQRLFDLVKVHDDNPMLKKAFFSVLGNMLVVDDLDTASSIAYNRNQRHKVVTKDGVVIEKAGTMTGGGRAAVN